MAFPGHSGTDGDQLELSKKIFELSTVIEVSKEFISTLDPERIDAKVVFTMMGVVGAKRGAFFLYAPDKRRLDLRKAVNFPHQAPLCSLDLSEEECRSLEVLSAPVFLSALEGGRYAFLDCLRAGGQVVDPLLIPLVAEGNFLGFVSLAERLSAPYGDDDLAMLSSLANYSALALHKKKMVEMLIRSEKMAELGRLGSGIVHEIKNPLTSIIMLSEMLLNDKGLNARTGKYLSIIAQEAQRILRLSQNILSLARPRKPEMKAVELNRVIEETVSLVEYELKKNKVELRQRLHGEELRPLGDEEKLKQVLLNLVMNGVQAMEGGGVLEIATGLAEGGGLQVPEGYHVHTLGEAPGPGMVVVTVADGGSGIEEGSLEKIFESFFTTKGESRGTGLGLYVTRNIILEHRGRLTVMSRPGAGTVFRIDLPLAGQAGGVGGKRKAGPRRRAAGRKEPEAPAAP